MESVIQKLIESGTDIGLRLLGALAIWIIGSFVVRKFVKKLRNGKALAAMEDTVASFLVNFLKFALYIVLVLCIVGVLGVPMASLVAVLASAGVAIGLALQGSLANFAGGIMLLIFKPFRVGDHIVAGSDEGIVEEISMFYTILKTWSNVKISIPNGALMNASVYNNTCEDTRRVDIRFSVARVNDYEKAEATMLEVLNANDKIKKDPAPFAAPVESISGGFAYEVRAWVDTDDYWEVYKYLMEEIPAAMKENGVSAPAPSTTVIMAQ